MQKGFLRCAELLPPDLRHSLTELPPSVKARAEEIRLRVGRPAAVLLPEGEMLVSRETSLEQEDLMRVTDRACGGSLHSVSEQLRKGYICTQGGIRIGLCGTVFGSGRAEGIRDISSLSIRIQRQIKGVGGQAIRALRPFSQSVLIVSPPGGGKTTFLRELIRQASESGKRLAVCDERGEVAACCRGECGFDLGPCCDVLSGAEKAEGIMMLLKAMNPQIIAMDEISAREDISAIERAACCGTAIIASAHGLDPGHMRKRPLYARLLDMGLFEKAVVISGSGSDRKYRVEDLC